MKAHKYDKRGANVEGDFGEAIYDETQDYHKVAYQKANKIQDCQGIDRFTDREENIKARKNAGKHLTWLEVAAAGQKIGTGWVFRNIFISQMMVYEEFNYIKNVIFGRYYAPDALENIINKKVNLNLQTRKSNELNKVYHRWWEGEHRGATVCTEYTDLESLKSFEIIQVPRHLWPRVEAFYKYKGII